MRLLLVEDKDSFRRLLVQALAASPWEVTAFGDPGEALHALASSSYDVLVTDLEMPDEDGVSLLRRARRMMTLRGRRLPALALTAYGRSEDRVRALAAGFNLHLGKPVNPAELVLAVASLGGRTE